MWQESGKAVSAMPTATNMSIHCHTARSWLAGAEVDGGVVGSMSLVDMELIFCRAKQREKGKYIDAYM